MECIEYKMVGHGSHLDIEVIWSTAMTTTSAGHASGRESDAENSYQSIIDEFAGFLVNPAALTRGGAATKAIRNQRRGALLDRMAQLEVNRFWRAEIAAREHKCQDASARLRTAPQ